MEDHNEFDPDNISAPRPESEFQRSLLRRMTEKRPRMRYVANVSNKINQGLGMAALLRYNQREARDDLRRTSKKT